MKNKNFIQALRIGLLITVAACSAPTAKNAPTKVNICYSAISVPQMGMVYARDKGLFAKYNIEPNLVYFASGPQAATALIAGQTDICTLAGSNVLNAAIAGADIVMIGGIVNQPIYSLVVRPEIKTAADLKGKAVAITQAGSNSDISMRAMLNKLGLKPDTDVAVLNIGSQPERILAMDSGVVVATLVSPPETVEANERGYRVLLDMTELDFAFQHTSVASSKKFIKENRATALTIMKILAEAIAGMKQDKTAALNTMAKFYNLDPVKNAKSLEEAYTILVQKYMQKMLYPTLSGLQNELDFMKATNPKANTLKIEDVVDMSIVQELEKNGVFAALYK